MLNKTLSFLIAALGALSAPAFAVTVTALTPSQVSPQPIGKTIRWTATAMDASGGPVAFQFNITPPNGASTMTIDFNLGTANGNTWTSRPFVWVPTGIEGTYKIQVIAKNFTLGKSAVKSVNYQVTAVATSSTPVVVERTANPLVALFSTTSCTARSTMRVAYQKTGTTKVYVTNWVACHPPATMTFEVAGMVPSTTYKMYAQTKTGGKITNGSSVNFTTGALPTTGITFPSYTIDTAAADTTYPVIVHNPITFASGGTSTVYPDTATDLSGNIIWYYQAPDITKSDVMTRPLPGGGFLTLQDDYGWDPVVTQEQFLRQIDLAGNIVRETNMGAIQQELTALGAVDGGSCTGITNPVVGTACAGSFHHDAIATLPNGGLAALLSVERIYPAGTQGDTTGLPVDIIGDMIVVLNSNWQAVWYWDSFDPEGGFNGYAKLPISRTAPLGEPCTADTSGCPPVFLLNPGTIAPLAHDWLHANSLYYWPNDGATTSQPGDIIWSSRHQDFVFKIDYKDGAGTKDILWRMGPTVAGAAGDFAFNNTYNDPWPWFSHQHDFGIENGGAGPTTIFDNGNTRISSTFGLGSNGCKPYDCDSRGMAITFDESTMQVTPIISLDLGGYSTAMGSAQLEPNGNYFFVNPIYFVLAQRSTFAFSEEFSPSNPAPQMGPAVVLFDLQGPQQYRGFQMPSLYNPPTT